jgi:hypothetical protein
MRILSLLIKGLVLTLLIVPMSSAASQDQTFQEASVKKVVKQIKLKAKKGAEVILPDFTLIVYEDGTRSVGSSISYTTTSPALAFDFEVDPDKGTYKTKRLDSDEKILVSSDEQAGIQAVPGFYVWKVLVEGKDPAFIIVNRTTNRLEWKVNQDGTTVLISYVDECYARNPTPVFETHWFTTSCRNDVPFYVSGTNFTRLRNVAEGSYINWDWNDRNLSTTANSRITLTAYNDGTFSNDWLYEDAGEDAILLRGTVTTCRCY